MNILAVTACPTGIAHSQMAAENLENAAEEMGHEVHVEVQGAMGTENEISDDQIADADVVIVAADTTVRTDRFGDTPVVKGGVQDAVNDAEGLVREAEETVEGAGGASASGADGTDDQSAAAGGGESTGDEPAGADGQPTGTGGEGAGAGGAGREDRDRQGIVGKLKSLFS